jgi:transcriptional regulator
MYVPKHFAVDDACELRAFIKSEPFGILVSDGGGGPVATHVPIVTLAEEPLVLGLHVAKANAQWRSLDGRTVLAIFHGAHAMVSASWYAQPQMSVPTWNYTAVHCTGTAHTLDGTGTREILERMVVQFEPSWRIEAADSGYIERMEQAIVGVRIEVSAISGVRKHSQNRTPEDRRRVVEALAASARCADREVAQQMRAEL